MAGSDRSGTRSSRGTRLSAVTQVELLMPKGAASGNGATHVTRLSRLTSLSRAGGHFHFKIKKLHLYTAALDYLALLVI